ncbi:MAG TPA: hypothetical protein VLK84_09185 [Longimicrobium sp.]|nr:hypothetical protein [Longimicrobium sp.]
MRTLLGLIIAVSAYLLLSSTLGWVSDPAAMSDRTGVFPFAPPPWQWSAGEILVAALLGWLAVRLLNGGIVGRMVRGRGLSPEPARR